MNFWYTTKENEAATRRHKNELLSVCLQTPDAQIPVYPHHHWYDNGFVDRKAFKKDALY